MSLRSIYRALLPASVRNGLAPVLHPLATLVQWHAYRHARGKVISGPFRGMKIQRDDLSWPIVLGTYELELHEIIEHLQARKFLTIVDIGAAEGYYAVGMALLFPDAFVIAFEANPRWHGSLQRLAALNNVSPRISLRGACHKADLQLVNADLVGALIIVDVEGYEKDLLDPEVVPALRHATLVVEVHDGFVPGCTETVKARFAKSHTITEFRSRPRRAGDYPIAWSLSRLGIVRSALRKSISDGRTVENGWLFLEPRS